MGVLYFTDYLLVIVISYTLKNKIKQTNKQNHWIMWKHQSAFVF